MISSPLVLSLASVFTLLGLTLVAIAVVTDNWTEIQVNRREIINAFKREPELSIRLQSAFGHDILYFSRVNGLFHTCFPDTVPQDIGSYSKFNTPCIWNNEFNPPEARKEKYNTLEWYRLYAFRSSIIFYITGILVVLLSLITGLCGCWNRSKALIVTTAISLVVAALFMCIGMIGWHYVAYSDRYLLDNTPYYKSWEPILKLTSRHNYGWSYIVSWVGISFLMLASIFMFWAYISVKKEEEELSAQQSSYFVNYYEKSGAHIVPYSCGNYATYGHYPYVNQYNRNDYFGYLTYDC